MPAMTYYDTLGVAKNATEKEIKAAYKKLVIQWHPDKHGGSAEAITKSQDINRAYETLSNAETRAEYDASLKLAPGARNTGASSPPNRPDGSGGQRVPRPPDPGGMGFGGEINDIMGGIFGGTGRVRAGGRPGPAPTGGAGTAPGATAPRGESMAAGDEVKIEVTLEEAFHGSQRTVRVNAEMLCPDCNGTGTSQKGRGGLQMGTMCLTCRGAGRKKRMEEVPVNIRPGVYEGAKLRAPGKGPLDSHGKPTDMRLVVHLKKHNTFTVEESNLSMDLPVPYTVLALGGEVQVPTLAGGRPLTIPAGTKPMQRLRMPGLGLPALKDRPAGDLFARIQVDIPTSLSAEERRLLTDLARLRHDPIKS